MTNFKELKFPRKQNQNVNCNTLKYERTIEQDKIETLRNYFYDGFF